MSGLFCWLQTSKALTPIKLRGPFGVSGSYFSIYHSFLSDFDHFQKREKKTVSHVVRKIQDSRYFRSHIQNLRWLVWRSHVLATWPHKRNTQNLRRDVGFQWKPTGIRNGLQNTKSWQIQASNSRGVSIGNCAHELAIFDVKPGII